MSEKAAKKDFLHSAANKNDMGMPIFYLFERPMRPKYKKHNRIKGFRAKKVGRSPPIRASYERPMRPFFKTFLKFRTLKIYLGRSKATQNRVERPL